MQTDSPARVLIWIKFAAGHHTPVLEEQLFPVVSFSTWCGGSGRSDAPRRALTSEPIATKPRQQRQHGTFEEHLWASVPLVRRVMVPRLGPRLIRRSGPGRGLT